MTVHASALGYSDTNQKHHSMSDRIKVNAYRREFADILFYVIKYLWKNACYDFSLPAENRDAKRERKE